MGNNKDSQTSQGSALKVMTGVLAVLVVVAALLGGLTIKNLRDESNTEADSVFLPEAKNEETEVMLAAVEIDTIYDNISINGFNVGKMTKAQALTALKEKFSEDAKKIILADSSENYEYTFKDFNAGYNFESAVDEAYAYARDGSLLERFEKVTSLKTGTGHAIEAPYTYDSDMVISVLYNLEEKVNTPPEEASMRKEEGVFITEGGKNGRKLNVDATAQNVYALLDKAESGTAEIIVDQAEPKFTEESLKQAQSLIGTFNTYASGGEDGRMKNIRNALDKIDGTVLNPEEIFSTNQTFGVMTSANGYHPAPTIVAGKFVDDMGGGICQVSSTLYMALLYSEVEIVERRNHSLKVGYADYGFDATLAGDYIDLKFKNNTEYPIYLEGYMDGRNVTINIYGFESRPEGRTLKFVNQHVQTIPAPETIIVEDDTLPLGSQVNVDTSRTGYKYNLYKVIYTDGQETDRVLVNTSHYVATQGKVRVGTNPDLVQNEGGENAGSESTGEETVPTNVGDAGNAGNAGSEPGAIENPAENGNPEAPADNETPQIPVDLLPLVDDAPPELDLAILNALQNQENN